MFKKLDSFMEEKKKELPIYLLVVLFCLVAIGCIFVYSSSSIQALVKQNNINYYFIRQSVFAIVGVVAIVLIFALGSGFYKRFFPLIYGFSTILLILVHFIGTGSSQWGAKSWIRFGGIGVQPSEIAKISIVITFAYLLEKNAFSFKNGLKKPLLSLFLIALPITLVMLEPDLGSVAIMAASIVGMLFFTKIPLKFFVIFGASGFGFLSMFMKFAAYRMNRINAWLDPFADPLGISYQIIQSFYAIGSGGLFGEGIGGSKQKFLWLPEGHTDFIFAIITEETGFFGASILILLFLVFFIIIMYMGKFKENIFEKFTIIGLGFTIAFQAFLNIMVVSGLFPVTGITLPFISYGGTSLVISCAMVGIILSLYCE